MDIFVDGSFYDTGSGTGYTYSTNHRGSGSYTFQVCEAGTNTSSDTVMVNF